VDRFQGENGRDETRGRLIALQGAKRSTSSSSRLDDLTATAAAQGGPELAGRKRRQRGRRPRHGLHRPTGHYVLGRIRSGLRPRSAANRD
jgi:hypothetical protein